MLEMVRVLFLVALAALLPLCCSALYSPQDRGPLFNGSTAVRSLDVQSYEAMLQDAESVWLVDYYSSWCAHCRMFAPEWEKVGEFYAQSKVVQVGAVDCNQHKNICQREEVHAYPSVKAHHVPLNSNEKVNMEVKGRKKMKPVVKWVEDVLTEHGIESGVDISTIKEENMLRRNKFQDEVTLGDDTSIHMKYKRLRDAGKSAMLALENSLFIGAPVLEGERYDAALIWVDALAATFPMEGNRVAMTKLVDEMKTQKNWSLAAWVVLLGKWRRMARETSFPSDLFDNRGDEGTNWEVCKTYTCGLWSLFHTMATRDVKTEAWKPSMTVAAIRLYMKYFFGCEECRQHFLEANPESIVEELATSDANGPHAVVMWAWKMHNSVNTRLQRDQWPSIPACSSCYIDIGGPVSISMSLIHEDGMVDYLTSVYGNEDKAIFDEIIMTATFPFQQGFSAITGATLFFALVAVLLKTQRHRFVKENGHLA